MVIGGKELLIILIVALVLFYIRKPSVLSVKKSLGLERITAREEMAIGRQWLKDIGRKERVVEEADARVTRIVERLLATGRLRFPRYHVSRLESPAVNAMALPGGYMLTTRGLMVQPDLSEEELAGILAHEIGHIELGHSRKALVRSGRKQALLLVLSIMGRNPGMAGQLAGSLVELGISRESEIEADDFAVKLLGRAGYPPEGLLRFFQRARKFRRTPDWLTFLSTHPAMEERIERLSSRRATDPTRDSP
jgi:beta-barrel assembly-enhancing protease